MDEIAIRANAISKRYQIGVARKLRGTLRDQVADSVMSLLQRRDRSIRTNEAIWALRDVSFEIKRGEVVGFIGPNGAGKTTLLKILSRVTKPTIGSADIFGRVGSLLEVGTGFHSELTGRENIYLNGAILGMKKQEIDQKFDEIVDFAGTEKFLDTPIKRYSSGMAVRLAFAVSAHLDTEILLVDEVLAVGDVEYQEKCLGKMRDIGKLGRTVLLVSHNMHAIAGLCKRAILLKEGRIVSDGKAPAVVSQYIQGDSRALPEIGWQAGTGPANYAASLVGIRARNKEGRISPEFDIRRPIGIDIDYEVIRPNTWFSPAIQLVNEGGILVFNSAAEIEPNPANPRKLPGLYRSTCWIPGNFLPEGSFTIKIVMWGFSRPPHDGIVVEDAVRFYVYDNIEGDSVRGRFTGSYPGVIRPMLEWTTRKIGQGSVAP